MNLVRTVIRSVGELFITLGLLVLMFAVYQIFYTNLQANRAQAEVTASLEEQWASGPTQPGEPPKDRFGAVDPGVGFALLYVPRLGDGWRRPIVEGTDPGDLSRGVGHYPASAMPGEIGNFAVAGHRAGHGEPFRDLNTMQLGDAVVVETEHNWYIYQIYDKAKVKPSEVGVVLPVPNQPGAEPTEELVTLTTCDPRYGSTHRLIFWGKLESVQPKAEGGRPAVLGG